MSGSGDGSIRQWKSDGEPVGEPWDSDGGAVYSMAISPDKTVLASGSADGRLRLWNIREGDMVGDPWEAHETAIMCLDWSPNAREIASGSQDGTMRRWSPNTGRQIAPQIETGHGRLCAIRYSPQGDKFLSGGDGGVICLWSKDGELLMEIKGHENLVRSLCWSKDGAYIFSASSDNTIRKWKSIDGKALVVFRGHSNGIHSICLSPDESYLISASIDYSVRIWDLKTNQPIGNPLLHDDELWALAISPDGKYIASAGSDAKVYIWSLEAALKQQGDDDIGDDGNAKRDAKLKGRAGRPRHTLNASLVSKQQPSDRGLAKYGKDFWDTDTNPGPPLTAPPATPSPPLYWRNLLGFLGVRTRPANAQQSIPLAPRRWNFSRFSAGRSIRTVDVAPCQDEDRYGIVPETDAEAAAAMQRPINNEAGSSIQPGQLQAAPGTQVSQGQPTETQGSSGGTRVVSCEVRCCGLFFSCGRPTSHQS